MGDRRFWDKILKKADSEYEKDEKPLYRAYGVWKRAHPVLGRIGFYALRTLIILELSILGLAFFAGIFSLIVYGSKLVATVFLLFVFGIVAFILTKALRKRLAFYRRLRKLCKKEKFRLKMIRKPWKSFFWSSAEPDFILSAGMCDYYVHFLTVAKYNSTLSILSPEEIERISYPIDNKFTVIFEFKPTKKTYRTDFKPMVQMGGKRCVRAIIVNPVCKEMYEKDRDGTLVATGNGLERFGYTLYTGSGFIESVKRDAARGPKGKITNY